MLANLSSHPPVRWRLATHTQGLPCPRLPLMPAQNVSSHVPSRTRAHSRRERMTHAGPEAFAAFVRLDWADAQHAICLQMADSTPRASCQLEHTPEAICLKLTTGPLGSALRDRKST